jgi:hypothetical protein
MAEIKKHITPDYRSRIGKNDIYTEFHGNYLTGSEVTVCMSDYITNVPLL